MSVTCKYENLFFPCFYLWLVIVLCRHPCLSLVSVEIYFSHASMVGRWQYSVGMGNLFFPCLFVWQVLLSDVLKDVGTSIMWQFLFPNCGKGIYFSSAIGCDGCWNIQTSVGIYFSTLWHRNLFSSAVMRLCYYLIRCCILW